MKARVWNSYLPCNGWACLVERLPHLCLPTAMRFWAPSRSLEISQILEVWEKIIHRLIPRASPSAKWGELVSPGVLACWGSVCLSLPQKSPFPFHGEELGSFPLASENFALVTRDLLSLRVVLCTHGARLKCEFQVRGGLEMTCMGVSLQLMKGFQEYQ